MDNNVNLLEPIGNWRSIRKYKPDPVEDDKILAVLEAARRAPSASNAQPWHFIVVRDLETRKKLRKWAFSQNMLLSAPVVIICCGDLAEYEKVPLRRSLVELVDVGAAGWPHEIIDKVILNNPVLAPFVGGSQQVMLTVAEQMGFAISFLAIEARHQGLGVCIIGGVAKGDSEVMQESAQAVRNLLGIPDNLVPLEVITLGYPDENPSPRPRKTLEQIVSWEHYSLDGGN